MASGVVAGHAGQGKTAGNLVCDLDGVLYLDTEPIPGAGETLTGLELAGWRILLVTNNSSRTVEATVRKVADLTGYRAAPERVLGSGQAAATLLDGAAGAAFVVGEEGLAATLRAAGIEVTDEWREAVVVVVGLDRRATYDRMAAAARAVRSGARFVATNVDPTYPTGDGLAPGCGSLTAFIAAAADQEPEVAGKPYPPMRALVREAVGPGPTYVVGDRIDTDLEMGRLEGWKRVLVLSGAMGEDDIDDDDPPDLVLDSIADLPSRLG